MRWLATIEELKGLVPDTFQSATTRYDSVLRRLLTDASALIERECGRHFVPHYQVRYFNGMGEDVLIVPDLVEIDAIEYSTDGQNFTALASSDYVGRVWGDENDLQSYRELALLPWGSLVIWPAMMRGVKISGWWGYTGDRSLCWESAGTLAAAYTAGGATIAVSDAGLNDVYGLDDVFQAGRVLRIEDEMLVAIGTSVTPTPDTVSVIGGWNGTSAVNHLISTAVKIWRVDAMAREATIIQAVKMFEQGAMAFGDGRANAELGQIMWVKKMHPEAMARIEKLRVMG